MITRIEIDGFKSFSDFSLDLQPFTAIVGPNASGKSNLFDAIRFLAQTAERDLRTAMKELRGEPEELFRMTAQGQSEKMSFAIEVLVSPTGEDNFGLEYELKTNRLRYEITLERRIDSIGRTDGIFIIHEGCWAISKKDDHAEFAKKLPWTKYNGQLASFIEIADGKEIRIRQDGPAKRGRPVRLPLQDAARSALSTITTAEFPHLYALRELLLSVNFLQIDPQASRRPGDRLAARRLEHDASNLATVLAHLRIETCDKVRPDGVIADLSLQLSSLVPSVRALKVREDPTAREYVFDVEMSDNLRFSSRVISDGTLRILALLTILNDPVRSGLLCFEEPENGIHEGRIPALIEFLRDAAKRDPQPDELFQIIINTHSPAVMKALHDKELVASDTVRTVEIDRKTHSHTRMRSGVIPTGDLVNPENTLTRVEIERILRQSADAA